ncbi:MAG TPA: DNA cytosine methyltransferase [Solirubrobacterales bacterium]|nr:DNA cytosine methyltransferase [Solirubrobacterales bacterium]
MSALTAVDLFSGAGGTTHGLRDAGFKVLAAIENDSSAAKTFAANHPDTHLLDRDIRRIQAPAMARRLRATDARLDLLTACPPCQPFSTLGTGDADDPRNALVSSVGRFIRNLQPRTVLLENVPGLRSEPRFVQLVDELKTDFDIKEYIVQASDFGIPQNRRRVILLGIERAADVSPPDDLLAALPADFDASEAVAGDALKLAANLNSKIDPIHRARESQPMTLERIRAMKPGGGRLNLPKRLQLACHNRLTSKNATSIYGRIDPLKPAPTMTTRCTTPSCGRFVHPTEDRGLTLREAALLQSFPLSYSFSGTYGDIERQIGNAVPPKLAEGLGLIVASLLGDADDLEAGRLSHAAA